jgi:hypothetical protein
MLEPSAQADAQTNNEPANQAQGSPRPVKRERSSIGFPYDDLAAALKLVEVAHNTYGGSCTADQLAAAMRMSTASGSFRMKVSAGRMFGVLGGSGSAIETTLLGNRALDPGDTGSRGDAFLNVPLYRELYRVYEGLQLPGDEGLEAKIRELGVPAKQVTTARQVFLRSAEQAGFFTHGKSRLVMPPRTRVGAEQPGDQEHPDAEETPGVDHMPAIMKHPLVQGLLAVLPDPGEPFPAEDREMWLKTLEMNLSFIYGRPSTSSGTNGGQQSESPVRADPQEAGTDRP